MLTNVVKKQIFDKSVPTQRRLPVNYDPHDADFFEGERNYETSECCLSELANAVVTPESIVYQSGMLVKETLYEGRFKTYYRLRYPLKTFLKSKKIALPANVRYLLATDTESGGHFHWMTETMPRLLNLRESAGEFVLLLPDTAYMREIAMAALRMAKISFADFVFMRPGEIYAARDLSYVSRVAPTGRMHDPLMKELNEIFSADASPATRRLYISRSRAKFRRVLNEDALTSMLVNNGFEVVYGEGLSLAEQIELFSAGRDLIGIHGAGLTNCLFMRPGANVVELRRREINVGYWFLADSLGHNYYYYNGTPDSDKTIIGRGCNLTIDVDDFEKSIIGRL